MLPLSRMKLPLMVRPTFRLVFNLATKLSVGQRGLSLHRRLLSVGRWYPTQRRSVVRLPPRSPVRSFQPRFRELGPDVDGVIP